MTDALLKIKKGKSGHRGIHKKRTPCEDGGRDWGHAATSQGAPETASQPPGARRGLEHISAAASEGASPADILISDLRSAELRQ